MIIDGHHVFTVITQVAVTEQVFDMSDGTLRTSLTFGGGGARGEKRLSWSLQLNITQLVSRAAPTLALMKIDGRISPPSVRSLNFGLGMAGDGGRLMLSPTKFSMH